MVDFNDGKVFLMIFCLFITVVVSVLAYVVPPPQTKNYGNYSLQPTELQKELPNMFKSIAPILIIISIHILYLLYQEFKLNK